MTAEDTAPDPLPEAIAVTDSGDATASTGGIANTGVILGPVSSEHHHYHHYPAAASVPVWPIVVGQPPGLASAFQPRLSVRDAVLAARRHGEDVVLSQREVEPVGSGTRVLAGGGGVGKSQLAAWFAEQATQQGTDLVVWVSAGGPEQIVTAYARAAVRVGAPGAEGTDPTGDAEALLEWLRTTERTWLIVLDDITDSASLRGWWPPQRSHGWTLATTRLHEASLASSGRREVPVDVYSPEESAAYLTERLTEPGLAHLLDGSVDDLAVVLGHLPLALSHAAAFMIDQEEGCAAYLARFTGGTYRLAELMPADADPDGYGRPVAVTLLLALEAADAAEPAGLARPALDLAAVLDPDGHPDALWATAAVTEYLSLYRSCQADRPVTADQARKTLRLLHRYGLLAHTVSGGARAVRIHALTARAARETGGTDLAVTAHTAADALRFLWPADDHNTTDLVAALRANTMTLAGVAGDLLWIPDVHPLLFRSGVSLLNAGLHVLAIAYWQEMSDQAVRVLGDDHAGTLTTRSNLASAYWQAGRTEEAIALEEQVADASVRVWGVDHPGSLTSRSNLASAYWQAGRTDEANALLRQVCTDSVRVLGRDHPTTLIFCSNLANFYCESGRNAEAIALLNQVIPDLVRVVGEDHPYSLFACGNLAAAYLGVGRIDDAIALEEHLVADRVRVLGENHPSTVRSRGNLAAAYLQVGRSVEAVPLLAQVLADSVRLLGSDHPDTLTTRTNLASAYWQAGQSSEAILLLEQVVPHQLRVLGKAHPDTLAPRRSLASAYWQVGRTAEAILLLGQVVADSVRMLGQDHPDTVAAIDALQGWQPET